MNLTFKLTFSVALVLLFQNCSGTTLGNPIRFTKAKLKFASFNSKIESVSVCLTNVNFTLRSDDSIYTSSTAVTPIPKTDETLEEFDSSYLYYDPKSNRYSMSSYLYNKNFPLNPNGTDLGEYYIPEGDYDLVTFGFTNCGPENTPSANKGLTATINGQNYADNDFSYVTLKYEGVQNNKNYFYNGFPLDSLLQAVENSQSQSEFISSLKNFRDYNLVKFTATSIAGLDEHLLRRMTEAPDNKIVLAGSSFSKDPNIINDYGYFVLSRYNEDGAIDTSFASNGVLTIPSFDNWNLGGLFGVAASSVNNMIYAVGTEGASEATISLMQVESNGALLPKKYFDLIPDQFAEEFGKDIIASENNLFILGVLKDTPAKMAIIKTDLNANKVLNFGAGGVATISYSSYDYRRDRLHIKKNNDRLTILAQQDGAEQAFLLAQLSGATGALRNQFGSNGLRSYLSPVGGHAIPHALAVTSNDQVIAVGENDGNFIILKTDENGNPEANFCKNQIFIGGHCGDGFIIYDFGGDDSAQGVAIASNGDIYVSGQSKVANNYFYTLLIISRDGSVVPRAYATSSKSGAGDLLLHSDQKLFLGGSDARAFHLLSVY